MAKAKDQKPARAKPSTNARSPAAHGKTKPAAAPAAPTATPGKPLPAKVQRFIDEYLIDMNGAAAYKRAGYAAKGNSAEVNARRLLRNAQVSLEIARRQSKTAEKLEITREEALQEAWNIVKADPRDLIEYRRFACPDCFGDATGKETREPRRDCTACAGEGRADVMIKDTRKLSPQAAALYAGVKITKDGIEVKMHSKLDALEKIFKHLGLYALDKRVELTGAHGGPVQVQGQRYNLTDEELVAIAAKGLGHAA